MSEEIEVETKELQETIDELQEERRERAESERKSAWTRYIALTTAILAVFAAIGALQSGTLVNEAMILQLKASDKWNEYQADRQKEHLYRIPVNSLLDSGVKPPAPAAQRSRAGHPVSAPAPAAGAEGVQKTQGRAAGRSPGGETDGQNDWKGQPPPERLREYIGQVSKEARKENDLKEEAEALERQSEHRMHLHHEFARSVALIQVAIALSAVAALTKMKPVWAVSLVVGLMGLGFFAVGWWALSKGT